MASPKSYGKSEIWHLKVDVAKEALNERGLDTIKLVQRGLSFSREKFLPFQK